MLWGKVPSDGAWSSQQAGAISQVQQYGIYYNLCLMQFWAVFKKRRRKCSWKILALLILFFLSFDKLSAILCVIKWTKRLLLLEVTADVMFYLWLNYHRNPGELFSQLSQAVKSPLSSFYASHCPVLLSKTLLNMLCTVIQYPHQAVFSGSHIYSCVSDLRHYFTSQGHTYSNDFVVFKDARM